MFSVSCVLDLIVVLLSLILVFVFEVNGISVNLVTCVYSVASITRVCEFGFY